MLPAKRRELWRVLPVKRKELWRAVRKNTNISIGLIRLGGYETAFGFCFYCKQEKKLALCSRNELDHELSCC
jgi:hypothetical protein